MSEGLDAATRGEIEAALGHRFAEPGLLETALTHASHAHESSGGRGNERLEFLGDAVIDLVIARLVYEARPDWDEGELTRTRAALVNREALAERARTLALDRHVRLGRTERQSGGSEKPRILANCFEAVIGALFLDAGLDAVERLARRLFDDAIERGASRDPKTEFQEWAHAQYRITPTYRTAADTATEDDERRFTVEVCIGDDVWGVGVGRSKRRAERDAARVALERSPRAGGPPGAAVVSRADG